MDASIRRIRFFSCFYGYSGTSGTDQVYSPRYAVIALAYLYLPRRCLMHGCNLRMELSGSTWSCVLPTRMVIP